jgi:predicted DsbA family dithiol-disulfide isomerase
VEALHVAYFTEGKDVGDPAVLQRIASSGAMSPDAMRRSIPLQAKVADLDNAARSAGLAGVPGYLSEGRLLFSGAQGVGAYVQALAAATSRP